MTNTESYAEPGPIRLGGGPHGLGDPEDNRLRKVEKDIVIRKRLMNEATKKCGKSIKNFLECAEKAGLFMPFQCREQYNLKEQCLAKWLKHESFVKEVTDKYLEERSHYRRTGQPLHPPPTVRKKKEYPPPIDEEFPQ